MSDGSTILFVEPPTPFWVGGNELRGDKRIFYLVLAMCLASVLLNTIPPLRSLFDLVLLDGVDYLLIAVCVVIWLLVVRWVWRARILERFLALDRIYQGRFSLFLNRNKTGPFQAGIPFP